MTLLAWRASQRSDREAFKRFACATPPQRRFGSRRRVYPRPWEREVEAAIRSTNPACQLPDFSLTGWDRQGDLGAIVVYQEIDGAGAVQVLMGAVALRFRRQGGAVADEMATMLLNEVTAKALDEGKHVVRLSAVVHQSNVASQQFCQRTGLHLVGQDPEQDPSLQVWSVDVVVGGASLDAPDT